MNLTTLLFEEEPNSQDSIERYLEQFHDLATEAGWNVASDTMIVRFSINKLHHGFLSHKFLTDNDLTLRLLFKTNIKTWKLFNETDSRIDLAIKNIFNVSYVRSIRSTDYSPVVTSESRFELSINPTSTTPEELVSKLKGISQTVYEITDEEHD